MANRDSDRKNLKVLLLVSNKSIPEEGTKASFMIYHPERNNLLPRIQRLRSFAWRSLGSLINFSLVVHEGQLYLIGGFDSKTRKYKRNIVRYDLPTGRWFFCTKLKVARASFTPFVLDSRIYCSGGMTKGNVLTDTVEFFEPRMNETYSEDPLPMPCAHYTCVSTNKGDVFIIGGLVQKPSGSNALSNHFWMSVRRQNDLMGQTLEWEAVPQAAFPAKPGIHGHESILCAEKNRIYVVGGSTTLAKSATEYKGLHYMDLKDFYTSIKSISSESDKPSLWKKRYISECEKIGAALTLFSNKLFVFGGQVADITGQNVPDTGLVDDVSPTEDLREERDEAVPDVLEVQDPHSSSPTNSHFSNVAADLTAKSLEEQEEKVHDLSLYVDNTDNKQENPNLTDESKVVGYYDWHRKTWKSLFSLDSFDMDVTKCKCAVIPLGRVSGREFSNDRLNWLLQWSLW